MSETFDDDYEPLPVEDSEVQDDGEDDDEE